MTDYRLTRRGRLLLQTFPLFLVVSMALNVAVARVGDRRAAVASPGRPAATEAGEWPHLAAVPAPARPAPLKPRPRPAPATTAPAIPRPTEPATTGRLVMAPGSSAVHGSGPLRRFTVEVEAGLAETPAVFARAVERVLFDSRSWGGAFQRVSSGPVAFRVVLAGTSLTDRLCAPLDTGGIYSCFQRGRVVVNARRWRTGATTYGADVAAYRIYVVNHEVGHALGHGHRYACGPGGLAPVMIQQTKSLRGCRANPWPLVQER